MALVVVLFHYQVHWFDQLVSLGVSFFFVASGALLVGRHRFDRLDWHSWWQFVKVRALRIYPQHWLALIPIVVIYYCFHCKPVSVQGVMMHAALLQGWVPSHDVQFGYNGAAWFLGAILFCYACYPVLRRYYCRWHLGWQLLTLLALGVGFYYVLPTLSPGQREYTYTLPVVRLYDFMLGMTMGLLSQRLKRDAKPLGTIQASLVEVSVLMCIAVVTWLNRYTLLLNEWDNYLVWWLPAALLVLVSIVLDGHEGYVGRLLRCRPLVWLGRVCMAVYLLQFVVSLSTNYLVAPVFGHFGVMIYGKTLWLNVVLLLLVAEGWTRWVDAPLRRWAARRGADGARQTAA